MRYYSVPFSAKGEDKLFFNLTIQESMIVGVGIVIGAIAAKIMSVLTGALMIYCLPVAIPFVVLSVFLVIVPIKHVDGQISLFQYCLRRAAFNRRPRHYLRKRRDER